MNENHEKLITEYLKEIMQSAQDAQENSISEEDTNE